MEERRRYKRIAKTFMSRIRFNCRGRGLVGANGCWDMVTIRDIGAGGMLFNYDRPLQAGTKIALSIIFPFKDMPINCAGTVLRSERVDINRYSPICRIAAQFERIGKVDKGLIDKVANEMCA